VCRRGRTAEPFSEDTSPRSTQAARGKPGTVNNICTAALIVTAGTGKN
jgi:type II secretory pathway predicted ATPase ExeA